MAAPFDCRTRGVEDARPVDPGTFTGRLPDLLAERGELATGAFRASHLPAFTVAAGDDVHTWRLDRSDTSRWWQATTVSARADLPLEWFSDIVTDQRSAVALMVDGLPVMTRSRIEHLMRWERRFGPWSTAGRRGSPDGSTSVTSPARRSTSTAPSDLTTTRLAPTCPRCSSPPSRATSPCT